MNANTKEMFEEVGEVKKIDINGMAVFDMPLLGKDGKPKKGATEEMKIAVKCERGDRVVKLKGKPRSYMVIPANEWASMPATEEDRLSQIAAAATPQLAELAEQMNAIVADNKALKEKLDALQGAGQ